MKKAWIENNVVRDVAHANPADIFHKDVAKLYDTDVPDDTMPGAALVGGAWVNPVPVEPVEPVPPAPVVPQEVSRRRGLQALYKMYGLTETAIEAKIAEAIANPDEQYLALTEFRTSQTFERNRALVVMMGTMLDLDLDALFILASSIP